MTSSRGVPEEARTDETRMSGPDLLTDYLDAHKTVWELDETDGSEFPCCTECGDSGLSTEADWVCDFQRAVAAARASGAVEGAAALVAKFRERTDDELAAASASARLAGEVDDGAWLMREEARDLAWQDARAALIALAAAPSDALAVHDQEVAERIAAAIEARAEFWGHPGGMALQDAAKIARLAARGGRAEGDPT